MKPEEIKGKAMEAVAWRECRLGKEKMLKALEALHEVLREVAERMVSQAPFN